MYSREGGSRYIKGDSDPKDVDWTQLLSNTELLYLLERNGKIRKACHWVAQEAFKNRFILANDPEVLGTKFGRQFTFPSTIAWLEWMGFFDEMIKGVCWARLFGESRVVFFENDEKPVDGKFGEMTFFGDNLVAYHPMANGMGYEWHEYPDWLTVAVPDGNDTKQYMVHASRSIRILAPKITGKYAGDSEVGALSVLALIQEQLFKSTFRRLHLMGAGVMVVNVLNEEEKLAIEGSMEGPLSYLNVIYTTDPVDKTMLIEVPDLKSQQFREFWDISQEEVATAMNFSKKLISGDPQGQISSADLDAELSYAEVYHVQRHYKRFVEHALFLLGIENTEFQWVEPRNAETNDDVDDIVS